MNNLFATVSIDSNAKTDIISIVIMTQPQELLVRLPILNDESLVRVRKITHSYRNGGARTEH